MEQLTVYSGAWSLTGAEGGGGLVGGRRRGEEGVQWPTPNPHLPESISTAGMRLSQGPLEARSASSKCGGWQGFGRVRNPVCVCVCKRKRSESLYFRASRNIIIERPQTLFVIAPSPTLSLPLCSHPAASSVPLLRNTLKHIYNLCNYHQRNHEGRMD